jgi:hypothetical protein
LTLVDDAVGAARPDARAPCATLTGTAHTIRPAAGSQGRHGMTYMGHDYYPEWLDNLADNVTLEAGAMDGTAQGSEDVRSIVVTAKELYEHQEFKFARPVGDYGFLEDYTTQVRGEHISVIVAVAFNAAGQTQHVVVNHRPRSSCCSSLA